MSKQFSSWRLRFWQLLLLLVVLLTWHLVPKTVISPSFWTTTRGRAGDLGLVCDEW